MAKSPLLALIAQDQQKRVQRSRRKEWRAKIYRGAGTFTTPTPIITGERITEDEIERITEDGQIRITE